MLTLKEISDEVLTDLYNTTWIDEILDLIDAEFERRGIHGRRKK